MKTNYKYRKNTRRVNISKNAIELFFFKKHFTI